MVDNAEKGLERACKETGAQVLEYTAAPVFMAANANGSFKRILDGIVLLISSSRLFTPIFSNGYSLPAKAFSSY